MEGREEGIVGLKKRGQPGRGDDDERGVESKVEWI